MQNLAFILQDKLDYLTSASKNVSVSVELQKDASRQLVKDIVNILRPRSEEVFMLSLNPNGIAKDKTCDTHFITANFELHLLEIISKSKISSNRKLIVVDSPTQLYGQDKTVKEMREYETCESFLNPCQNQVNSQEYFDKICSQLLKLATEGSIDLVVIEEGRKHLEPMKLHFKQSISDRNRFEIPNGTFNLVTGFSDPETSEDRTFTQFIQSGFSRLYNSFL